MMRLVFIVLSLMVWASASSLASPGIRAAVDKQSAHSALSALLLDAIEAALRKSPRFAFTTEHVGGTLVISLQSSAKEIVTLTTFTLKRVKARERVRYEAKFVLLPSRILGANVGICWRDELADCADQVLKSAQVHLSVNQP